MLEVPIPREADETADRQRIEERVSDQGSPVQVQHLQNHTVKAWLNIFNALLKPWFLVKIALY